MQKKKKKKKKKVFAESNSFQNSLILDNAPGHQRYLDDLNPYVEVVYLLPNTTPLIQPMDRSVLATFKAHYL